MEVKKIELSLRLSTHRRMEEVAALIEIISSGMEIGIRARWRFVKPDEDDEVVVTVFADAGGIDWLSMFVDWGKLLANYGGGP